MSNRIVDRVVDRLAIIAFRVTAAALLLAGGASLMCFLWTSKRPKDVPRATRL